MSSWIDLGVIAAYLIGTTLFGCSFYFRRGARDAQTFMSGGGRIPGWVLALSIFATYVSSISFLAWPAKAYLTNWNIFALSLSIPLAAGIAVVWFVPFYRRMTSVSAYTFLEERFGFWARAYASGCFLLMQSVRSGMILFLLALLLKTLLGVSIPGVIFVVGLSTMVYAMLGGLQAVVWTDALQAIILIGGALLCLVVLGCTLPAGFAAGIQTAYASGKFSLGSSSPADWGTETFWVTFIYGVFLNLQNFGIDQSYTQRYVAAKSEREAVRSMFSGAMLYVPVSLVFVAIGTLLWIWVQGHPNVVPADVLEKSDAVFPWFIVHQLPTGITGLLVAAIIAAAMSTVSATLNSGATVLLEDYRKRFARSPVSPSSQLCFLRLATFGLGVFAMGIAWAVMNVRSVLTTQWAVQSVVSGGMLGLFLLGVFAKRTHKTCAIVATVLGILVVLWIMCGQVLTCGHQSIHLNLAIVLGTMTIVLVGALLPLLKPRRCAVGLVIGLAAFARADGVPGGPPPDDGRAAYLPRPWTEAAARDAAIDEYAVWADGRRVPLHTADVDSPAWGNEYYFGSFVVDRPVKVRVCSKVAPKESSFVVDRPRHIVIERAGRKRPLVLFADPPERDVPRCGAANVIWFGAGYHDVGKIVLRDNQTLYLAPNAVVSGGVEIRGTNVTIRGRGILDGRAYRRFRGPTTWMFDFVGCRGVRVEGVICRNPFNWVLSFLDCEDVVVDNFKLCGGRMINDDAVDICNCRRFALRHSFFRCADDVFAIKGNLPFDAKMTPVEDVEISDCTAWTDAANIFRIGFECNATYFRNIRVRNIDVLHASANYRDVALDWANCVFYFQPANDMPMEDMLFENICIHGEGPLAFFSAYCHAWGCRCQPYKTAGSLRNVCLRNVSVEGATKTQVLLRGHAADRAVEDVRFENVTINGKRLKADAPNVTIGPFARNILFN